MCDRRRGLIAGGFAVALALMPRAQTAFAQAPVDDEPAADAVIEKVTLAEALARARARNPDALVAADEVRLAAAQVTQVRAASLPSVVPTFGYTRLDGDRVFMAQTIESANQIGVLGGIIIPLIVPQRWADWAHAVDGRKIAALSLDEVQRRVAIAVAHAYLTVIVERRVIAANVNARDTARAHAAFAEQQFAAGAVSRLDAVRAGQQWHTAQAQVTTAEVALVGAQEALGILVAGDRPIDAAETPRFPLPTPVDDPHQAPPERLRADILAQALRRDAALRQVRDSWTDYMPYIIGSFGPQISEPATIFQPRYAWQGQVQLVLPLFEGGLRLGQLRARRARLGEATTQLAAVTRQARAEIRRDLDAARRAQDRVRETATATRLAREALAIANLRYREGASTNIDVIDAERQARDTALDEAAAEDNERQVRLDLLAAAGQFP